MYSQILSEKLGVSFDDIDVVFGDSDRVRRGAGSHGSRSARMGGSAAAIGADKVIARAREAAAEMWSRVTGTVSDTWPSTPRLSPWKYSRMIAG